MKEHYRQCMKVFALAIITISFTANANDFIGIPIGSAVDFQVSETENPGSSQFSVEGPFNGLFAIFGQYDAHVSATSGLLVMAEAERTYESFKRCSDDTTLLWTQLKQKYGSPAQDDNQNWWFDVGNQQKASVSCSIYGKSGKIALNMRVVDTALALEAMPERDGNTANQ